MNEDFEIAFESAWATRVRREVDEVEVPFLSREALIANKRATGRLQDLADVAARERGSGEQ